MEVSGRLAVEDRDLGMLSGSFMLDEYIKVSLFCLALLVGQRYRFIAPEVIGVVPILSAEHPLNWKERRTAPALWRLQVVCACAGGSNSLFALPRVCFNRQAAVSVT
jgi:hypothetical protein